MILNLVIIFFATFLAGYVSAGAVAARRPSKKTLESPCRKTKVRVLTVTEKPQVYN